MENEISQKGIKLLSKHKQLGEKLKEIPNQREMYCRIIKKNGCMIGKPRFVEPLYVWEARQLKDLLNHLQDIWDYLQQYHYYFDRRVLSFIDKDARRSSKESIVFLLERDVWETDEVFGDYLIEKHPKFVEISYFRRDEKRKTFTQNIMSDEEIREWIMRDAREQIISTFEHKWALLSTEIDICASGLHLRAPVPSITQEELRNQVVNIKKLLDNDHLIASALLLGRASEIWCIISLGQTERKRDQNYLWDMKQANLINGHQYRLLNRIRVIYNSVKHKADFQIQKDEIRDLYYDFCKLFKWIQTTPNK